MKKLRVISLFDGMSCGQIALERLGLETALYAASEIDKHAMAVTKHNFPNTVHMGSVTELSFDGGHLHNWMDSLNFGHVDLLMGGSPCQNFSFAGTRRGMVTSDNVEVLSLEHYLELKASGFEFKGQSYLFWEFVRILKECRPKYFLLENVKMVKKWQDLISDVLGVEPIEINSSLVSAQGRKRLYWTNIPNVALPEDRGIVLKDIVHETVELGYDLFSDQEPEESVEVEDISWFSDEPLRVPEATKLGYAEVSVGDGVDMAQLNSETRRGRKMEHKSNCLTAKSNELCLVEALKRYVVPFDKTLEILDKEVQRGKVGYFRKDSQANRVYFIHGKAVTLCGEAGGGAAKMGQYLFGCITPDRVNKRQNGQRFNNGNKFYTLTAQDQHGILVEGYIRKLTPVECERLQTVPDGYTSVASESQRYRMLGNGWTVDVIAHILKNAVWE